MRKFERKRKTKSKLYSIWSVVFLAFFAMVLVRGAYDMILKEIQSRKLKDESVSKLLDYKERKDGLVREIQKLETEEGIEEEIRNKFGVVKEGEELVVIVKEKEIATSTEDGFFDKFKSKLSGWFEKE